MFDSSILFVQRKKAPRLRRSRAVDLCLCFDLHAAGHGEDDIVLRINGKVVDQAAPKRLVKLRHHLLTIEVARGLKTQKAPPPKKQGFVTVHVYTFPW